MMRSTHPDLVGLSGSTVKRHFWIAIEHEYILPPGLHQPGADKVLPISAFSIGYLPGHVEGCAMASPTRQRQEKVVKLKESSLAMLTESGGELLMIPKIVCY